MSSNGTKVIKPIKEIIHSNYPSLTKSEQKVASFVLDNIKRVMYYSVTDLADEVGVGETTVLRFCRRLGFKGYQDFKLTLAQNSTDLQAETSAESSDLIQSISLNTIESIKHTASMINLEDLNEAITILDKAEYIHFYGVGTSGITALDAKSRFLRIGRRTEVTTDPHLQAMYASTLSEKDVVIGFSVSGSTMDTIHSLEIAKKSGAKVIAITYYSRSPITKIADVVLNGGAKESPLEGGSLTAKISQLFVVDLLCTGIVLQNKERSMFMKNKTAQSVINKIF
ncbi:MurR/RpiR family transcriptional regulator [Alkalihalobacillus sp. TS-13]|uniref:MurR/RpiR family transcriptional regulator n=1 Tax=Alkalihalobacillus sp. TS-13 TaxID=2842455 RepID=UPI001C87E7B0|nr:MurR/RpiR family transcriptional regulator [Alkalihalobacillus sp. TS-13]